MSPSEELPTPEQVDAALTEDTPEELKIFENDEEKKIGMRLMPALHKQAMEHAEAVKAKELNRIVEELRLSNANNIQAELDKMRKANTPLTPEELAKLVNQEYIEYTVTVSMGKNKQQRNFVIGELAAAAEKKLITAIKKTLSSRVKELSALDWSSTNTTLERLDKLIEMVPGALDTIADCVAICLDPHKEDADINGEWVMNYMTIQKMLVVLRLQAEVNRWRDFFSLASQFIPNQMTA